MYIIKRKHKEVWVPLKYDKKYNFVESDHYLISNHGRIFSKKSNEMLSLQYKTDSRSGYKKIQIALHEKKLSSKRIYCIVSRLVALAFIPNTENKPLVNHKNGNSWDNYYENLEWETSLGNTKHAIRYGLIKAQLTEDQVHEACKMMEKPGWDFLTLIKHFGGTNQKVSHKLYSVLRDIRLGAKYKSITKLYKIVPPVDTKLQASDDTVKTICESLLEGIPIWSIAASTKCNRSFIQNIYHKKVRTDISDKYFTRDEIQKVYHGKSTNSTVSA